MSLRARLPSVRRLGPVAGPLLLPEAGTVEGRARPIERIGVLKLLQQCAVPAEEADLDWVCVDAAIVRAHRKAAGATREKGALMPKAWVAPAVA